MSANMLYCLCPGEKCNENRMTLWQVKCGTAEINKKLMFGVWMYVYCQRCGGKMMMEFVTQKGIFEWRELAQEVPLTKPL